MHKQSAAQKGEKWISACMCVCVRVQCDETEKDSVYKEWMRKSVEWWNSFF